MGSEWRRQLNGDEHLEHNSTKSECMEADEEELSMRIMNAGGAVLDTINPWHEMSEVQDSKQFAAFSRTKEYIFGWPDDGGLWMLHLNGLVLFDYWELSLVGWDGGFFLDANILAAMERQSESVRYRQKLMKQILWPITVSNYLDVESHSTRIPRHLKRQ